MVAYNEHPYLSVLERNLSLSLLLRANTCRGWLLMPWTDFIFLLIPLAKCAFFAIIATHFLKTLSRRFTSIPVMFASTPQQKNTALTTKVFKKNETSSHCRHQKILTILERKVSFFYFDMFRPVQYAFQADTQISICGDHPLFEWADAEISAFQNPQRFIVQIQMNRFNVRVPQSLLMN